MLEPTIAMIQRVMDGINHTLALYEKDFHHAPADWLLEQWWSILNTVKVSLDHVEDLSIPSVCSQEDVGLDDQKEA